MSENDKIPTLADMVSGILDAVREYYDSEYVYYIEKNGEDIDTLYESLSEGAVSRKEKIKLLTEAEQPKWLRQEITDSREENYSVFRDFADGETGILAAVGVHRGGCDVGLLRVLLPYIPQAITLHKQQKQQEYLSFHDNLTGLLNRNSLVAHLGEMDTKKVSSLGALSADINGLKNFNQEFGRDYGDEVVTRVGEVLEEHFRSGSVYRLTGDEYLVLVENISYENFLSQVHKTKEKLDNISLGLASIGYAWEKVDIDAGALMTHAENMMRSEKKKYYKNQKKGHHEPVIKQDLLEDLQQGNFIVCLVPKVDVHTGEVTGAEALVRYHHKDLGIMEPGRYLELLEETKLSHYLDLYVFEQVCSTLNRWNENDIPMIPISVNFAGSTLRREDLEERMNTLIEKYHVLCEYLEVEVSEANTDMNQEMLSETCEKIRKANVRVVLDHYGSKESSFSILSMMEFDGVKFDKGLVGNLVGNIRCRIAARAVAGLCRQLGASVLADGVETQDQLNVLEELGCDTAQGALFNKPITIETFETRYLH